MEKYLNTGIKAVISEFPAVADILSDEYGIACVACSDGTCLLKDVVGIHNLTQRQEVELLLKIEKIIYPDRDIDLSEIESVAKPIDPREIEYSPPIKKLVNEHVLIKRLIALIPAIIETFDVESEPDRQLIRDAVDFIRSYADKFHHAKEEDILFEYSHKESDIIKTMYEDHKKARNHVKAMMEALEKRDKAGVVEHLREYGDLLTEHIKKEDEILYPWIDRELSIAQVVELFSKFDDADNSLGADIPERYERFVNKVEEQRKKTTEAQRHGERHREKKS
jgi:hemerythrin-like domain-containing protein